MMLPEVKRFLFSTLPHSESIRGEIRACCPFHSEDTPSFFIYEKQDYWWYVCFGCQKKGTLRYLVQRLGGHHLLEFIAAPDFVPGKKAKQEDDDGITFRVDQTAGWPDIYYYYNERGIPDGICRRFGFKFDSYTPAAIMPVYTLGRYVGYIGRNLDPSLSRYYIQAGINLSKAIWGFDDIDPTQPTIITEGQIDAASWWAQGVQAVALLGKVWQTKVSLLQRLENAICVPDNEAPKKPGDKTSLDTFYDLSIALGAKLLLLPPGYKDSNDYHNAGGNLKKLLGE